VPKLVGPCAFKRSISSSPFPGFQHKPKSVGLTSPSRKHSSRAERPEARMSDRPPKSTKLPSSQRKSQVQQVAQKNQDQAHQVRSPQPGTHTLLTRTRRRARNEPLPAHDGGRPARAGSSAVNALAPAPPAPPTNAPRSRPPLPDSSPPQQQLPPLRLLVGPSGPSAWPLRPTASNSTCLRGGVRPSVRWNASSGFG
jgi:hypothetical protein